MECLRAIAELSHPLVEMGACTERTVPGRQLSKDQHVRGRGVTIGVYM